MVRRSQNTQVRSVQAEEALRLFAALLEEARRRRAMPQTELAERAGISRTTLRQVLRGSPTAAIGVYFEIAVLVGVPLFSPDEVELQRAIARSTQMLALLPKHIHPQQEDGDADF